MPKKPKPLVVAEGIVMAVGEGSGELKGKLGWLGVMGENGAVWQIGRGFTVEQRERFWELRRLMKGRKVRLAYGAGLGKGVFFKGFVKEKGEGNGVV